MIISPSKRLDEVNTYYFARKLAEIDKISHERGVVIINLGIGNPDLLPPKEVLQNLEESVHLPHANSYQPYKGIPVLRRAFATWYKNLFGIDIEPDNQVLPLMGSKEGVMHISMSFLNPGDEVLVPDPGYPSYATCASLAGALPVTMPLTEKNDWKPDLDALARLDLHKVKMMWINYPNMPTGAIADPGFFNELVAFAKQFNLLICHDNPYTFLLNDHPLSIFNAVGAEDCAIELVSLSKCYNMAGWRVGALIGAKPYIDTVLKFKSNMDSGMFKPVQEAAAVALNLGQEWVDSLNKQYQERKEVACQIMEILDLEYNKNGAGLFIWGRIKDPQIDSESLSNKLLYDCGVFITPGHVFGSQGNQYLRISLCSPAADLLAALYRIKTGCIGRSSLSFLNEKP